MFKFGKKTAERVEKFICNTKGHVFGHKIADEFSENHSSWEVCSKCHIPTASSQAEVNKSGRNKWRFRILLSLHRFTECYSMILRTVGIGIMMLIGVSIAAGIIYCAALLAILIMGKWAITLLAIPLLAYPVGKMFVD